MTLPNAAEQPDETAKALVLAAFHEIEGDHVRAYCDLVFNEPGGLSARRRKQCIDALFRFANLGWSAFHAMNKGEPLKERPKRTTRKTKKK